MNSKNLGLVGAILMAASLILLAIGGYRFLTNLAQSEEAAMAAAERKLAGRKDAFGNPMNKSLMGVLEMQSARSAIQSRNRARAREREKALQFLIPGVVVLLAGGVCFGIAAKTRRTRCRSHRIAMQTPNKMRIRPESSAVSARF